MNTEEWQALAANLREPFPPEDIDFRPGATTKDGKKALALGYVNARAVMDRLDKLVGPENWTYTYEPLHVSNDGVLRLAKAVLTIYGIRKEDIGEASRTSPSMGCVSHGLKRVAVQWGMGRDLYDLPQVWLDLDGNSRFNPQDIKRLRARLPQPKDYTAPATTEPEETEEQAPVFHTSAAPAETAHAAPTVTPVRASDDKEREARAAGLTRVPAEGEEPDLSIAKFLEKCNKELGLTDPNAIMRTLGVKSLSGLYLREALEVLRKSTGKAEAPKKLTAGAQKAAPAQTEPGTGSNTRQALRALGERAGIVGDAYLETYRNIYGDDFSYENERAWGAFLTSAAEKREAKTNTYPDGDSDPTPDLAALEPESVMVS